MWLLVIYLFLFLIIWLVVIVMKESDVSSEPRCKLIRICFFSFFLSFFKRINDNVKGEKCNFVEQNSYIKKIVI